MQREQLSDQDRFMNNLNDVIDMKINAHRQSIDAGKSLLEQFKAKDGRKLDSDVVGDEQGDDQNDAG